MREARCEKREARNERRETGFRSVASCEFESFESFLVSRTLVPFSFELRGREPEFGNFESARAYLREKERTRMTMFQICCSFWRPASGGIWPRPLRMM